MSKLMVMSSVMIISSFFLPWKDFIHSYIFPLQIFNGLLGAIPTYVERSILLIPLLSLVVLIGLYIEKLNRSLYGWFLYFLIGMILMGVTSLHIYNLDTFHIGSAMSLTGSVILCVSAKIRK